MAGSELQTLRLRLRLWRDEDRAAFAAMHADADVMADLGGPITNAQSNAKLDAYLEAFQCLGIGRWLVETLDDEFLGYAGVMPIRPNHALGDCLEVGWRLVRSAWGKGYATEAAEASLRDAFKRPEIETVFAYTAASNVRSQAVMERLGLRRDLGLDYQDDNPIRPGRRLVWVADQRWNGGALQHSG